MSPMEFDQIAVRYLEITKVCVLLQDSDSFGKHRHELILFIISDSSIPLLNTFRCGLTLIIEYY